MTRELQPGESLDFDRKPRSAEERGGDRHRKTPFYEGGGNYAGKPDTAPRPDWMDDPSLLPKRPPGQR